jgi:glutamyl-tRNA synthetase
MNIEREKENPRKDYEKFGNLHEAIAFFYEDHYLESLKAGFTFNEKFDHNLIKEVLTALKKDLSLDQDEQSWFANMKAIGETLGFAPNGKTLKQNPDLYKGAIGDVAEMLRITLTGKKNSPNLYYVMKVLGKEQTDKRIDAVIATL